MKNGKVGALLNVVEAADAAGVDRRTIQKWIRTTHPDLGVTCGGTLFVRRSALEKIIDGPVESPDVSRVTIVGPNRVLSRVPPDVAHVAICAGATIPDDAVSFNVYQRWLNERRDALVEVPKPEREAEIERKLAVINEKLQWLEQQREAVSA